MAVHEIHIRNGPPNLETETADTLCGKTFALSRTTTLAEKATCKRCLPIHSSNAHPRDRIADPAGIRICAWSILREHAGSAPADNKLGIRARDVAAAAAQIEARVDPATAMVVARFKGSDSDLETIMDAIDEHLGGRK